MKSRLFALILAVKYSARSRVAKARVQHQGRLNDKRHPPTGSYGMVFYLCSTPEKRWPIANLGIVNVPVSNGIFTVTLDFGANFPGAIVLKSPSDETCRFVTT